jgi:hypothetical protein
MATKRRTKDELIRHKQIAVEKALAAADAAKKALEKAKFWEPEADKQFRYRCLGRAVASIGPHEIKPATVAKISEQLRNASIPIDRRKLFVDWVREWGVSNDLTGD